MSRTLTKRELGKLHEAGIGSSCSIYQCLELLDRIDALKFEMFERQVDTLHLRKRVVEITQELEDARSK